MIRRYILTGAPGSGKTSVINQLNDMAYFCVAEAATDVISAEQLKGVVEPWQDPSFIDKIVELQKLRQKNSEIRNALQFYDRSPICTYAAMNA
jgi:predicted ATPase